MTSLTSLLTEVRACEICAAHLPLGPRPIVQVHPQARILIAGQAPGRNVHESGVPFKDASGDRLRAWLEERIVVAPDEYQAHVGHRPVRAGVSPSGCGCIAYRRGSGVARKLAAYGSAAASKPAQ